MKYQSLSWVCALVAVVSAQGDIVILEDGGELHGSVIKQDPFMREQPSPFC